VTVKVYVEGGGDHNKALQTLCRQGFSEFLRRAGLKDRMPRIVACGGRRSAYNSFRTSHESADLDGIAILLVDSEGKVVGSAWEHVRLREGDGWERPKGAADDQIHFMVQAMESWFHADSAELQRYYGQHFQLSALRLRADVENIPKADLFAGLRAATKSCQKGEYSKGDHSFQILAHIDPAKVRAASPHAEGLLIELDKICGVD
jgi:hypothetical protein